MGFRGPARKFLENATLALVAEENFIFSPLKVLISLKHA